MAHFTTICGYYTLNLQVLFYEVNYGHFDDRELNILWSHHIQYFIIKVGNSVHDQTKDNGPKLKLKNLYGNEGMN